MSNARPLPPFGYTVFCDDIRTEMFGKRSYIGVYNESITVFGTPPALISKFAMAIYYSEYPYESDHPLELVIFFPGDKDDAPTVRGKLSIEQTREQFIKDNPTIDPNQRLAIVTYAEFSPLEIKEEGDIKVRAIIGDSKIKLGALRVKFQPPPQAQTTNVSQNPT